MWQPEPEQDVMPERAVDVSLNIFAKPYQTALSLLSLLRHCERHIGRILLQFEPRGSRHDAAPPYAVAEYLREQGRDLFLYQPDLWIECDAVEPDRLGDPAYRLALRYQSAFEYTDKRYLFIMHNDVLIKKDIIGAMLRETGEAFAIGKIGQCWNCPASRADLVREAGLGDSACVPERYADFRPDRAGLERLYDLARKKGIFARPYWEGWEAEYGREAWPLPECRVNEWGCLVDVERTRPFVAPLSGILPFGAYEACGSVTLDIAVAWFRDLNRLGLRARHFELDTYLHHWIGSSRMTRELHLKAELEAQSILAKVFPEFAGWCRNRKNGLFL